jgi:hypothetical protein
MTSIRNNSKPKEKIIIPKARNEEITKTPSKPSHNSTNQNKPTWTENKIKKAKTAYQYFCDNNREKYTLRNPDVKPIIIMRLLGEVWRNTIEEDKVEYILLAADDKERYLKELLK